MVFKPDLYSSPNLGQKHFMQSYALGGLSFPPVPSGDLGPVRDVGEGDRVKKLGTLVNGTIGMVQLDELSAITL